MGIRNRNFVDEEGRFRIFHGFNDVSSAKGVQPSKNGENFTPKLSRNSSVISEWAEGVGVNCMRTPMMWAGANPDGADTYDDVYIGNIEAIVNKLAEHGIYSFLDMHQDVISSLTGSYDGIPLYLAEQTEVIKEYPWPLKLPLHGWGEGYLALQTGAIFQDIYDKTHGALTQWANFWKRIATTFKGNNNAIGYELINEPWPGNVIRRPSLMLPGNAGRKSLKPSDVVAEAIREVDEDHLIFYEPVTWGMIFNGEVSGSGFDRVPGGDQWKDKSVLSYHYYCWFQRGGDDPLTPVERTECDRAFAPQVFKEVEKDKAKKLGGAAFMTEFGGNSPNATEPDSGGVEEIDFLLDTADEYFSSWAFWDVAAFYNADTHESKRENLAVNARIYTSAIAGVPTKMKTVRKENTFELEYDIDNEGVKSRLTEIIVPKLAMEKGEYDVKVEGGAEVECGLGDHVVCVENDEDANSVVVNISPKK